MPVVKKKPLELDDDLPKGYLSNSAIDTYLACPHAFELQYVHGKPSMTTPPLVAGSTLHEVLEENNVNKASTGEDLSKARLQESWSDRWSDKQKEVQEWEGDDADGIAKQGSGLLGLYRDHHAHHHTPRDAFSIEKRVEGVIGGVPIVGYVDIIDRGAGSDDPVSGGSDGGGKVGGTVPKPSQVVVRDYKYVKNAKSVSDAETGMQLGIYSMLLGLPRVGFTSFQKTKEPNITSVVADRTPDANKKVENVIVSVAEAIKKGSFPLADPLAWKCSQKYCGVWWACKQGGGSG